MDSGAGKVFENKPLHITVYEMWGTDAAPAPVLRVPPDPTGRPVTLMPEPNGTVFRIADFEPDPSFGATAEQIAERGKMAFTALDPNAGQWREGAHPGMHRTQTFDYIVVLEGSIHMVLDVGEVHMQAGDVMVQCATSHAWSNRSGKTCRIAFVLLDATFEPVLASQFSTEH
jgi:mannose-6-phosphate isomerase-like protein (cupin superfamily)